MEDTTIGCLAEMLNILFTNQIDFKQLSSTYYNNDKPKDDILSIFSMKYDAGYEVIGIENYKRKNVGDRIDNVMLKLFKHCEKKEERDLFNSVVVVVVVVIFCSWIKSCRATLIVLSASTCHQQVP